MQQAAANRTEIIAALAKINITQNAEDLED